MNCTTASKLPAGQPIVFLLSRTQPTGFMAAMLDECVVSSSILLRFRSLT